MRRGEPKLLELRLRELHELLAVPAEGFDAHRLELLRKLLARLREDGDLLGRNGALVLELEPEARGVGREAGPHDQPGQRRPGEKTDYEERKLHRACER